MSDDLLDDDETARCIIHDRAFDQNIHVDALLWRFESTKADGASHESAVLRRLAPTDEEVHHIGCGIAASQNQRKGNPPPGKNRRYYCGFRTAKYIALPKEGNGYKVSITNVPEDGENAHVDVALTVLVEGKSARATRRTDAGLALAEHFGPPTPYRCQADLDDNQHPFAIWGVTCLTAGLTDRWPDRVLDALDDVSSITGKPIQDDSG